MDPVQEYPPSDLVEAILTTLPREYLMSVFKQKIGHFSFFAHVLEVNTCRVSQLFLKFLLKNYDDHKEGKLYAVCCMHIRTL